MADIGPEMVRAPKCGLLRRAHFLSEQPNPALSEQQNQQPLEQAVFRSLSLSKSGYYIPAPNRRDSITV
ncbi:PilT protein domain-containing protein [Anopheles sinensis]|uniref:PilT protein domain-containing protein n=1 Tax=Anopheles sinensis TaxID=74873 RepID=A0A084WIF1_ANOSI|nr:PilT protein domain-containing protein [Anopheles sinensis]